MLAFNYPTLLLFYLTYHVPKIQIKVEMKSLCSSLCKAIQNKYYTIGVRYFQLRNMIIYTAE